MRQYVVDHLDDLDAVLVVDDTGFLNLAYATGRGRTLIDRRLYLPTSWTDDRDRCHRAGIDDEVVFETKVAMAKGDGPPCDRGQGPTPVEHIGTGRPGADDVNTKPAPATANAADTATGLATTHGKHRCSTRTARPRPTHRPAGIPSRFQRLDQGRTGRSAAVTDNDVAQVAVHLLGGDQRDIHHVGATPHRSERARKGRSAVCPATREQRPTFLSTPGVTSCRCPRSPVCRWRPCRRGPRRPGWPWRPPCRPPDTRCTAPCR